MPAPWRRVVADGKRKPDSKSARNEWRVYKSENSLQAIVRAL
jgi:hypothetical protein